MYNYNNASIIITPNGYKDGKLYSLKGNDSTLVRPITSTRVNDDGITETMAVNVPLIDYSGVGDCPVINIITQDTYTISIPLDCNRVNYYKEDGTVNRISLTSGMNYNLLVGRYKYITFDYSDVIYNFDVDASWDLNGITNKTTFENYFGVNVGLFEKSGDNIKANVLSNPAILNMAYLGVKNLNYITINGLQVLFLESNLITTFNPTIALPNSLQELTLSFNSITTFNPTIALPNSLIILNLSENQMTLSGYTASETWATNQPSFTNVCDIYFTNNIDSINGTTLKTILLTKNTNIID